MADRGSFASKPWTPCSVPGCDRPRDWLGMCSAHSKRFKRHGSVVPLYPGIDMRTPNVAPRTCSVAGCNRPIKLKGMCVMHAKRVERHGFPQSRYPWIETLKNVPPPAVEPPRPCSVPGCLRPHRRNGLCSMHSERVRRFGTVEPKLRDTPLVRVPPGAQEGRRRERPKYLRRDPLRGLFVVHTVFQSNPGAARAMARDVLLRIGRGEIVLRGPHYGQKRHEERVEGQDEKGRGQGRQEGQRNSGRRAPRKGKIGQEKIGRLYVNLAPFWLPPMPDRPGASAVFYSPETAEVVCAYGDADGEHKLASPIISDAQGWFGPMWLPPGSYRLAMSDAVSEWMVQKAVVVTGPPIADEPLPLPKKDFVDALADLLEAYQEVPKAVIVDSLEVALEIYLEG